MDIANECDEISIDFHVPLLQLGLTERLETFGGELRAELLTDWSRRGLAMA